MKEENYIKYLERIKEEGFIRNRSANTIRNYVAIVNAFLRTVDCESVDELTLLHARNYIIGMRRAGKKPDSCNVINSAIAFFYQKVLHKSWDYNEVPRMKREWSLPEVMTLGEVEKLIETADDIRNKAIIALLYSSGLRVGELVNLAPKDIYKSKMLVHVRSSKNNCDRWTILSETALKYLSEYWYSYPVKREFLFVSQREPHEPLKVSGVETMLKVIGKDAGFARLHPHTLRHCFATHMLEQGIALHEIQAMLGHRSASSTAIYSHVTNKTIMGIKSPLDHPQKKKRGRKKKDEQ